MLSLRSLLIGCLASLLIGALASGMLTHRYVKAEWTADVMTIKARQAEALNAAQEETIQAERVGRDKARASEIAHEEQQQAIDKALADNRRLVRELGGLRDPGQRSNRSGVSETGEACACSAGSDGLSEAATDFLLEFAADADRVEAQYEQCKAAWDEQQ